MQLNFARIETQKMKIGTLLLGGMAALIAALFLGASTKAAVGGPTCNVPADYPTIQAAVDVPACTTVKVAAGTYPENVVVNRSVNIKGAKAGVPVSSRTFGNASESTVNGTAADTPVFTVNAANVTINGFSVTNPNHGNGIDIKTAGNNAVIKKNIVDTIGSNTYTAPTTGVYLELGPDGVQLSGNKINNIQSSTNKSAQGVLVGDSTSGDPSLNVRVDGNAISNITSPSWGAYGIQANNGASTAPTATGYSEVKIRGNTIKDLTGLWARGVGLEGETPNAVVRFNTISNLNASAPNAGAGVFFEDNPFFFTAKVNRNSIALGASVYGIAVNPTLSGQYSSLSVDGECNWWGAADGPGPVGPGTGSKVSPGVDFNPWLKSANLNSRCGDRDRNDHDQHDGDCDEHNWDDKRNDWNKHDD